MNGLSAEEQQLITPYISDFEGNVFAIKSLPEEAVAALFLSYAQNCDGVHKNLARLLAQQPTKSRTTLMIAQDMHPQIAHDALASVAEHAVIHLFIEHISIVASKVVEDCRIAAFTEKNIRDVVDQHSFVPLNDELPEGATELYARAARQLFEIYWELQPTLSAELMNRRPRPADESEEAYTQSIRTQVRNILRYLLPAGTQTHLGMTLSVRALEHLLKKMFASPLQEVVTLASQVQKQAQAVMPAWLRDVEPSLHRQGVSSRLAPFLQANALPRELIRPFERKPNGGAVKLINYDQDALLRVCQAIVFEHSKLSMESIGTHLCDHPDQWMIDLFDAYVAEREKSDAPLRALEFAHYTFELTLEEGAFRDLQRHRMQSQALQPLGMDHGYELPDIAHELGVAQTMGRAIEQCYQVWRAIAQEHPCQAQYVVPLACRRRYSLSCNLREAFHMVEVRTSRQVQDGYQHIVQRMWSAINDVHPWAAKQMRVVT